MLKFQLFLAQAMVHKMAIRDLSGAAALFGMCGVYLRLEDNRLVQLCELYGTRTCFTSQMEEILYL